MGNFNFNIEELDILSNEALHEIEGGISLGEFWDRITENGKTCWTIVGMMFATPGVMAANGAAGHEIMGFK